METAPSPRDLEIARRLLEPCGKWATDPVLNYVDPHTGQIEIVEDYRRWKKLWPTVNVAHELLSAYSHEITHKKNRRSSSRPGFLDNWMRRQSWQGRNNAASYTTQKAVQAVESMVKSGIEASVAKLPDPDPVETYQESGYSFVADFKSRLRRRGEVSTVP